MSTPILSREIVIAVRVEDDVPIIEATTTNGLTALEREAVTAFANVFFPTTSIVLVDDDMSAPGREPDSWPERERGK